MLIVGHLRYTVPDGSTPEKQLFSYGLVIFIFLLLLAALIFFFPGKSLIKTLINQDYISDVDYRYSILLLTRDRKSPISYSNIKKNPSAALTQLDAMLTNQNSDSIWLQYTILKTILYQPKLSPQLKEQAVQVLSSYLNRFKTIKTSFKQNVKLAKDALSINQAPLALYFYEAALAIDPKQDLNFYVKVAQTALWANECIKSSDYYFVAQDKSEMISDKRYFFILALKILFECNQFDYALAAAEKHIESLREDALTFQLLTELAIKADEPAKAQEFVLKLLQLQGASQN